MEGFDGGTSEVVSKSARDGLGLVCAASGISNLGGRAGLEVGTANSGLLNLVERGTLGLEWAWSGVLNLVLGELAAGGAENLVAKLGFASGGVKLNLVGAATGELNLDAREPGEVEEVVSLEAREEPGLEASGVLNLVPWAGLDFGEAVTELKRVARGVLDFILGVMPGELEGVLECLVMAAPGKGSSGRLMRSARSWRGEVKKKIILYSIQYTIDVNPSNTNVTHLLVCSNDSITQTHCITIQ